MSRGRIASLILFVVIGAAIGYALPGYRAAGAARFLRNFHEPYVPVEGYTRWSSLPEAAIALPDTGCRPASLRVRARSPEETGNEGLRFAIAGGSPSSLRAQAAWAWHDVVVDEPESRGGYLRFVLDTETIRLPTGAQIGVGFNAIEMVPPDTRCRLASAAWHAGHGVLLWIATSMTLLGGMLRFATRRRSLRDAQTVAEAAAAQGATLEPTRHDLRAVTALALVFAAWSVMKPPTQSPDEVDHVVRAAGLVRSPWVAVDDRFCVPPALANPLVFPAPPPALAALYFRSERQLATGSVRDLRALTFPARDACAQSHASSYPPLYYAAILAAASVAHPGLGLSPWNTFATMRLASAVVGALAWLPVVLLLRPVLSGERARLVVLPLALAPMTGFITGAVNPDAIHIPLAIGAGVAWFHALRDGRHRLPATALLLGALLTKPPGVTLLLALLLVVPAGLWLGWWSGTRAARAWRDLLLTGALGWAIYYVWSPPAPPGPTPLGFTPGDGLRIVWERLPSLWFGFWGILGYLDYRLPSIWYAAVAVPVTAGLVALVRRRADVPTFTWYALLLLGTYASLLLAVQVLLVGSIGIVLQGRYFLPAGLAIPLLALHAGRAWARALVAVVIVGMFWSWHLSVLRYFADGWAGWAQALPFLH